MIVLTTEEGKQSTVGRERHNIAKGADPADGADLPSLAALAAPAAPVRPNHWFR